MIESAAERRDFLDLDEFGVEAVFAGTSFPVIFDRESVLLGVGEVGVEAGKPTALCRTEDVTELAAGDTVEIDGADWILSVSPRPDGTGFSTLILREP